MNVHLLPILASTPHRRDHNRAHSSQRSSAFDARYWLLHDDTTPLISCRLHCTLTRETWRRFHRGRRAARPLRATTVLQNDSRCSRPRAPSISISSWCLLRAILQPFRAKILTGRRVALQAMQSLTSYLTACREQPRYSPSRGHPSANSWLASHR